MDKNILSMIWFIVVWLIVGYLLAKIYFLVKIKKFRQQSVKQSRAVVMWHVSEQLAPLLPGFPYHYKDAMFLGKGVDYIVFDGMHRGQIDTIIFLEVKSGASHLNKNEMMIKNCVMSGNIRYDVWRME